MAGPPVPLHRATHTPSGHIGSLLCPLQCTAPAAPPPARPAGCAPPPPGPATRRHLRVRRGGTVGRAARARLRDVPSSLGTVRACAGGARWPGMHPLLPAASGTRHTLQRGTPPLTPPRARTDAQHGGGGAPRGAHRGQRRARVARRRHVRHVVLVHQLLGQPDEAACGARRAAVGSRGGERARGARPLLPRRRLRPAARGRLPPPMAAACRPALPAWQPRAHPRWAWPCSRRSSC